MVNAIKNVGKAVMAYAAQKAARDAGSAIYSYGKKKLQSIKRRFTRRSSGTGRITTDQTPVATRGNGRRRRRSDRRFRLRVLRALNGEQALRTIVSDDSGAYKVGTTSQVTVDGLLVGGTNASASNDELWQCMKDAYSLAAVADAEEERVIIRSVCVDIDMTNADTGGTDLLVDVYYLLCRKAYNLGSNIDVHYQAAMSEPDGTVSNTHVALTPYQNSSFLKFWKITGHKVLQIKPGESANLQVKNNKSLRLYGKMLSQMPQGIPKYTRAVLFQFRGFPELKTPENIAQYRAPKVLWKARKTISYAYPIDRGTENRKEL